MGLFETIADRRIREARAAGMFDNLPGAGKPIPDLDQERPPGWWGARVVKTERDKMKFEDLTKDMRTAMPPLWRLEDESQLRERVAQLNERIGDYNKRTSFVPYPLFDVDAIVLRWLEARR